MRTRPLACLLLAGVAGGILPASAQTARSGVSTVRADVAPVIDGQLDDPAWLRATPLDAFVQVDPQEGAGPTLRTEFWTAFDSDHLYLAVRCFDPEPAGIIARQLRRDSTFDGDDVVRVAIATFPGGRDGYLFEVNPAGTQRDALIENNDDTRYEWDAIWFSAAKIDADGWTAEIAIPFKSLSFAAAGDLRWGLDVERLIRRRQETVRWASRTRTDPVASIGNLGELRGLSGLRQGRGVDLRPYVRGRYVQARQPSRDRDTTFDAGFDLRWRLTPQLTATLTVNTDFAEAEVDEREINLTRFPLFFPEKRDFFLQDAALFAFGGIGDGGFDATPYPNFTRRIGLTPGGQPVDILAGLKLTGQVGRASVGALVVRQDTSRDVPARTLAVARALVPLDERFSAGVLYTEGDPRGDLENRQVGFDLNYFDPSWRGSGRSLRFNAWWLGTSSEFVGDEDFATGVKVNYPHEPWDLFASLAHYGTDYDPALGFVSRTGIRKGYAYATRTFRPEIPWLRKAALGATLDYTTDLDGEIVNEAHDAPYFEAINPRGDRLSGTFSPQRERLDAPFAIRPGIVIPAGDYRFNRLRLQFRPAPARVLSGELRVVLGDYYEGTRTDYRVRLVYKPSRHLEFRPGWELRQVRLPQGNFDVRISRAESIVAFTPNLVWSLLAQHDNLSRTVGVNSRVRWTVRPGADVFLVVNQGMLDDPLDGWRALTTDLSLKAGWTFRF